MLLRVPSSSPLPNPTMITRRKTPQNTPIAVSTVRTALRRIVWPISWKRIEIDHSALSASTGLMRAASRAGK